MTIIAVYKSQQVEVLDLYEAGGVELAAVKALEGRPFVGGNKYPIRTEYTTVKAEELEKAQEVNR